MRFLITLLIMCFCFALGIFIVKNPHSVGVDYLWGEAVLPLYIIVLASVMGGLVFSMIIHLLEEASFGSEKRRLERQIGELTEELKKLKDK